MEVEPKAVGGIIAAKGSRPVFGDWFAVIAGVATLAGTVLLVLISGRYSQREALSVSEANAQMTEIRELRNEEAKLDGLSVRLLEQASGASQAPGTDQIASLASEVTSLQAEMKALDDAIGQSPDKALAVPLLQRDVDNMRESNREELVSTQAEIDRVYDQNKWFIGLMFTMAVGLVTLAVSNLLQVRKARES